MDFNRQYLLKTHRNAIVNDLEVDYIINKLLSLNTLSFEDYEVIRHEKSQQERAKKLLDYISRGDDSAFDSFVDSLQKYYPWLWNKLQINQITVPTDIVNENVEDGLSRGEVPKLPIHYVSRTKLEEELSDALIELKRHNVLLVHGMPGSGKSSLVIGTLRNNHNLIINTFKGNAFWINVGDCKTVEKITQLQARVLRRITPDEGVFNTSISIQSFSSMSGSFYEPDWEDHRDKLKKFFETTNLREALLIVDDLKDKKVLDAFNVGCKVLITTQDSKLAEEYSPLILNVPAFLSEQESLQLISHSVNQPIGKLPHHAKDMHNICKGSPLLMSMLGAMLAENKESLVHDKRRWSYFVKQLKNRPNFIDRFSFGKSTNDTFLAVEVCINSIANENFIRKYKSLVVLPENIKISVEALSTMFDMTVPEVEKLMKLFKTKSLIIEHYSVDHKMYLYEIHDLIMSYLIRIHKEDDVRNLHVDLLSKYVKKNSGLTDLPDDGYIAYHIGYHIYNTANANNMWSLFHTLYTNLEFIGNKIRLAGPSSMIDDLQYFYQIKGIKEDNQMFIDSLRKFISNHGHDLHRYPNTDILQSIFQHEREGVLYDEALRLAKESDYKDHLYLQFQYDQSEEINYSTIHIDEKLRVIKFWLHFIFVGNESGTITLWSINAYHKLLSYIGHDAPIKCVSINNIPPFKMASTCGDGILKVWNINHLVPSGSEDLSESDGEDNFPTYYDVTDSALTITHPSGKLCDVSWGRHSNVFLTHTNPGGFLILYNANGIMKKCIKIGDDNIISCSILSFDDSLAIVGLNGNIQHAVRMYSTKSFDVLMTFAEFDEIKMLSLIPNAAKCIFVLTKTYFQVHVWHQETISSSNQAVQNIRHLKVENKQISSQHEYTFQTAVIGKDSYIFIATTDCHILVHNLVNNASMGVLNNHRGNVITMDVMEYNYDPNAMASPILVTASGGDELSLKLWCVDSTQFSTNIIRRPIFDCVFDSKYTAPEEISLRGHHYREKSDPSTLRRAETLVASPENAQKFQLRKTLSLDKKHLRLTNLRCAYQDNGALPLIAIADNTNCVQLIKGKIMIGKTHKAPSNITCVALSPCGYYLSYGMENGDVVIFSLKTMTHRVAMQIRERVDYIEFLDSCVLVVAGKENCLMMYEVNANLNDSVAKMIVSSKYDLGSQELLDSIAGKRRTPELNGNNNNGSPTSESSSSSVSDYPTANNQKRAHRISERGLHKYSPTVKCFLLQKQLVSVARDGSVKLWTFEPQLAAVLVGKQEAFSVSCVGFRNTYLALCDRSGGFEIHHLYRSDVNVPLQAKCVTKYAISEKITCCNMSHDNKILAIGCSSGNIVLWHVLDKMLISTIKFHKIPVQFLDFSPTPVAGNLSLIGPKNDLDNSEYSTPLVLISLGGQAAWWNISQIVKKKKDFLSRHDRGSLLSPLAVLSPMDLASSSSPGESPIFQYPASWEKSWKGKKCKNKYNRKELLACIKLRGEKAPKIMTNDSFSSFITVDHGGILCMMNILRNNEADSEISTPNSE